MRVGGWGASRMPATDDEYEIGLPKECDEVTAWRYDLLTKAGYAAAMAWLLAESPSVDLHKALDLRAQGCDPDLAVRILT